MIESKQSNMKEAENLRNVIKRKDKSFSILLIISIIGFLILGIFAIVFQAKYYTAIHVGAKNVVTALEMVVACQQISNVTSEQVKEQYIKTFIIGTQSGGEANN